MSAGVTPGLRALLSKQTCFVVEEFGKDSEGELSMVERETGDLNAAHVVSSLVRTEGPPVDLLDDGPNLHIVVLDIDHPAHLVESSTPGHGHLYVEIPPVNFADMVAFWRAAEKIGLVQHGWVEASIRRGHSDVRLPWVSKADAPLGRDANPAFEDMMCFRCHRKPAEIEEYREAVEWDLGEGEFIVDRDVSTYVWENEGTLNRANGLFACTHCYVAIGMPSSLSGRSSWKPTQAEPFTIPVDPS